MNVVFAIGSLFCVCFLLSPHKCMWVCLFVNLCVSLVGTKKGSWIGSGNVAKKGSASPVKCPSMPSDYRNKQYQDGNKMCEKSSAFDRIRDKTDSNMKVCRFVTQQNLANQILWWRSHRIQKGTCTWKNTIYDTIRHLHLQMSSIIESVSSYTFFIWSITWIWCDWLKKNWNLAVLKLRFLTNQILCHETR